MKFIFPQNYNFKNKLFGIIDYTNLFLNIIWNFFIYFIIKKFILRITIYHILHINNNRLNHGKY